MNSISVRVEQVRQTCNIAFLGAAEWKKKKSTFREILEADINDESKNFIKLCKSFIDEITKWEKLPSTDDIEILHNPIVRGKSHVQAYRVDQLHKLTSFTIKNHLAKLSSLHPKWSFTSTLPPVQVLIKLNKNVRTRNITKILQTCPPSFLAPLLPMEFFSEVKMQALQDINMKLSQDYSKRRMSMLERLKVTVASLLRPLETAKDIERYLKFMATNFIDTEMQPRCITVFDLQNAGDYLVRQSVLKVSNKNTRPVAEHTEIENKQEEEKPPSSVPSTSTQKKHKKQGKKNAEENVEKEDLPVDPELSFSDAKKLKQQKKLEEKKKKREIRKEKKLQMQQMSTRKEIAEEAHEDKEEDEQDE